MMSRRRIPMMSYWKLSSMGGRRGDPMTAIDKVDANLEAALSLREIAACYLKFAEDAGNQTVWEARLRLAAKLGKEAAALEAASKQRQGHGHAVRGVIWTA
jgi:hypothetical protein